MLSGSNESLQLTHMITPEILFTPPYLQALLGYVMLFSYLFFNSVMRVKRIN